MKKTLKLVSLLVCLVLCLAVVLSACKKPDEKYTDADIYTPGEYTTLWNTIGSKVDIANVTLKDGYKAVATVDGKEYELGMDFLSMAMVYSTTPSAAAIAKGLETSEEIYNEWWKLYILRWNHLLPEIPLYSNQYFDVYNAEKIKAGTLNTAPYWGAADAILSVEKATGSSSDTIILGSSTALSGKFRSASYGVSSPSAADLDIQNLTTGYSIVVTDEEGLYGWADTSIVASHTEVDNDDGSKTYTVTIANGLKFSDGSAITAKNYVVATIVGSTNVYAQSTANGSNTSGMTCVGWEAFSNYEGKDAEGASKVFTGIRLIDEMTFSLTIDPEYLPYYYDITYAALSPAPLKLYLPTGSDIVDNGTGCEITGDFYATTKKDGQDVFAQSAAITANMANLSATDIPYSGPYVVKSYNEQSKIATLEKNEQFVGDIRGTAVFGTLSYIQIVEETQIEKFKAGEVDILMGVTGADATEAALKAVTDGNGKYAYNEYGRAGYGKMQFRSDFGPTMFTEVRQAIAYSIDRNEFVRSFTGGHGIAVNGPYFPEMPSYVAGKTVLDENLNKYEASQQSAINILKQGGWIYNADGTEYKDGSGKIRYKKLTKEEQIKENLDFHSQDNKYKTTMVTEKDGTHTFYMPLIINWYGTTPNPFSDLLVSQWASANIIKNIGMEIQYTLGDLYPMFGEFYHEPGYGWNGESVYGVMNFATGFTSTVYDYAYNWNPVEPFYSNYSVAYLKDAADIVWLD